MPRPKGAKDKKPRKKRIDLGRKPRKPVTRGQCKEAPHGYGIDGQPLKREAKPPRSEAGRMALRKVLEEKGKLPAVITGSKPQQPKALANREQIARMAEIGCTLEEISNVTGVGLTVLNSDTMKRLIQKHRDAGKQSLRRQQLKLAFGAPARIEVITDPETHQVTEKIIEAPLAPSPQMAIHLGKNWLGQVGDKVTVNQQNNFGASGGPDPAPRMSPETRDRLAKIFLRICPEAAQRAVKLDPHDEVQVA